jgi:hypothetical protein
MDRLTKALGLALSLPLASCINAQTYGTPRTLGPGKVQTTVGLDVQSYSAKNLIRPVDETGAPATDDNGDPIYARSRHPATISPLLPSVGVRMGAAKGVDIGLRLASGSSLDFNAKVNFLRTRYFDMAVMPGVQAVRTSLNNSPFSTGSHQAFFFQVPILMGVNITPTSTLLFNTGGAYMMAPGALDDARKDSAIYRDYGDPGAPQVPLGLPSQVDGIPIDDQTYGGDPSKRDMNTRARIPAYRSAVFIRAGIGFNQRITRNFALQPEISFLVAPDDISMQIINFGLGFNIGAQPAYTRGNSDEWSEDESVDRPEAVDRSEGKADVDPEVEQEKIKPKKIKVEQDPYEVEKQKKLEEEKAAEEAEQKRLEEEKAAAEAEAEKEKQKKKKKKKLRRALLPVSSIQGRSHGNARILRSVWLPPRSRHGVGGGGGETARPADARSGETRGALRGHLSHHRHRPLELRQLRSFQDQDLDAVQERQPRGTRRAHVAPVADARQLHRDDAGPAADGEIVVQRVGRRRLPDRARYRGRETGHHLHLRR